MKLLKIHLNYEIGVFFFRYIVNSTDSSSRMGYITDENRLTIEWNKVLGQTEKGFQATFSMQVSVPGLRN